MRIDPVVHHHFKFAKNLKEQTTSFSGLSFQELPFFVLVKEEHRDEARRVFENMRAKMLYDEQTTYNKINISDYKKDCCYRAEAFPMIFCKYNKQKFFVRGYYLRANDFFKIEITFHSDCLSGRKSLKFNKAYSSACRIFDHVVPQVFRLSPFPNVHLNEYFFVEDFKGWLEQLENQHNLISNSHTSLGKRALIENFKSAINNFEAKSKEIACNRLLELQKSDLVKELQRSNLPNLF